MSEKETVGLIQEIAKVLIKIEIVAEWYDHMTGGEYAISNFKALELLEKLDEVK